jgi:hypothetical protein
MSDEIKVVCETPTPGKQSTRIDRWKYDLLRAAILEILPRDGDGVPCGELAERIRMKIPTSELEKLGSLGWYTTTVKLDLEVKGEIERVPGKRIQHLRRKG